MPRKPLHKTAANSLHAKFMREFADDYRFAGWCGVTDLKIAQELQVRGLRRPYLTAKNTVDLAGDTRIPILAAVWDEIGNIFALLPNGKRLQYIGR